MFYLVLMLSLMEHFLLLPPQPSCVSMNAGGKLPYQWKIQPESPRPEMYGETHLENVAKSRITEAC